MTKGSPEPAPSDAAGGATSADPQALPRLDECRKMAPALRRNLERLDDDIRTAHARHAADLYRAGADESAFLQASATVLLSIAAGLVEVVAARSGASASPAAFIEAARAAALRAANRGTKKD